MLLHRAAASISYSQDRDFKSNHGLCNMTMLHEVSQCNVILLHEMCECNVTLPHQILECLLSIAHGNVANETCKCRFSVLTNFK